MLKIFVFWTLFSPLFVRAAIEPASVYVVINGESRIVEFNKLNRIDLKTINYHPNFKDHGPINYSGYQIREIFSAAKAPLSGSVTILGKTGQFSVELELDELLEGKSIIATHIDGKALETEPNGLQVIYDQETVKKHPKLKQRQYWCWWVRSFLIGELPKVKNDTSAVVLKSVLPWPIPYGISSIKNAQMTYKRMGSFLPEGKRLRLKLMNGAERELSYDEKTKFFLTNAPSTKEGGKSLHQVVLNEENVVTFVANHFYIKSFEVVK